MLDTSKVILGTSQFGTQYGNFASPVATERYNIQKILNICSKRSISQIDTSPVYGDFFRKKIDLSRFLVDTKIYLHADNSLHEIFYDTIESTKSSLGIKKINVLYLHNPQAVANRPSDMKLLNSLFQQAKNSGQINKVGISIYELEELKFFSKYIDIDVVQMPINFIDCRMTKNIDYINNYKQTKRLEVYARSVFLQGVLLNIKNLPEMFSKHKDEFINVDEWLQINKIDPLNACISYVESCEIVDRYVIGVQTTNELIQILQLQTLSIPVTDYPKIYQNDVLDPRKW